jgi:hypothetical protein
MLSYDGRIYFGLAGDRDVVPDLDDLASALREALREQPVPRAKPKPKPKAQPRRKAAAKKKPAPTRKAAPRRRRLRRPRRG